MGRGLRVIIAGEPTCCFENPIEVIEAENFEAALSGLDRAEEHLRLGYWIAGYLSYDFGLLLGAFEAPTQHPPLSAPFDQSESAASLLPLLASMSRPMYDAAVAAIQRAIYDGDVYQVNLTLPFHTRLLGRADALWRAVARETGARYQAYIEYRDRAILSWSPELFLAFDGERIETRPMKGTAPLERIDELSNAKNRAEHVMIVDLLRNDLQRFCEDVRVDALANVERYPTYATTTSFISGRIRSDTPLRDIFTATFPCGSVTGAPKRAAMREIARREGQAREVYCGSIGYLSPQRRGWWNVAIRTAQVALQTGAARFDVGGAIVADSNADDEWREIELKAAFLHPNTQSIQLLETVASDADNATLELHCARAVTSAVQFGIPLDAHALRSALCAAQPSRRMLIRVRIESNGSVRRSIEPLESTLPPLRIVLSAQRVRSDDPYLAHKTSHRPMHDAAFRQARESNCFDALLLNENGDLTEGARTNLFLRFGDLLWTPPLSCGLLAGILRQQLLRDGNARERVLTPDDLLSADAIFIGNSARGLLPAMLVSSA